jgi:hypothetical protein
MNENLWVSDSARVSVQFVSELNWEGVELPFEITTNPLGKHYITS